MGKCYNLDLSLLPAGESGSQSDGSRLSAASSSSGSIRPRGEKLKEKRQQLTMFYNGRVCVCNVTEIQAKAILCLAKREMDELQEKNHEQEPPLSPSPSPTLPRLDGASPSMKRSLQLFLQKRKRRKEDVGVSCP